MSRLRCGVCSTVLESKHVHDFVRCGCSNRTFLDGGDDYIRCGGMDLTQLFVIRDDGTEYSITGLKQDAEKKEQEDDED